MIIDLREIPVIWINLDSATKNAETMTKRLSDLGFKNTKRKSALIIQPPPGTDRSIFHFMGCGKSHTSILLDDSIPTPLLILEDDVEFTENFNPVLNIPDDVDGVYLGISHGNVNYKTKKYNDDYLRIGGVLATHAILYLTPQFRQIMGELGNYCLDIMKHPWDIASSNLQFKYKVITPNLPFCYQSDERDSANKWQNLTYYPLENRNSEFNDNI